MKTLFNYEHFRKEVYGKFEPLLKDGFWFGRNDPLDGYDIEHAYIYFLAQNINHKINKNKSISYEMIHRPHLVWQKMTNTTSDNKYFPFADQEIYNKIEMYDIVRCWDIYYKRFLEKWPDKYYSDEYDLEHYATGCFLNRVEEWVAAEEELHIEYMNNRKDWPLERIEKKRDEHYQEMMNSLEFDGNILRDVIRDDKHRGDCVKLPTMCSRCYVDEHSGVGYIYLELIKMWFGEDNEIYEYLLKGKE